MLNSTLSPSASRAVVACVMAVGSMACVEGTPAGPDGLREAVVLLAPVAEAQSAGAVPVRPITQARLVARETASGRVYRNELFDLDPTRDDWALPLSVELPSSDRVSLAVTIELLSTAGGSVVTEWSGVTAPISVWPGTQHEVHRVSLFRGPTDNLGITAVRFVGMPPWVTAGDGFRASANAAGGGPHATVYFASLDGSVATIDGTGAVSALNAGTARFVASAGPRADTVAVEVRENRKDAGSKDSGGSKEGTGSKDSGGSKEETGSSDSGSSKEETGSRDPSEAKNQGGSKDSDHSKDGDVLTEGDASTDSSDRNDSNGQKGSHDQKASGGSEDASDRNDHGSSSGSYDHGGTGSGAARHGK